MFVVMLVDLVVVEAVVVDTTFQGVPQIHTNIYFIQFINKALPQLLWFAQKS